MITEVVRGDYSTYLTLEDSVNPTQYIRAFLYRREWDVLEEEYTWETVGTELTDNVRSISNINKEYDITVGEFRVGSAVLTLENPDRLYGRDSALWAAYVPEYSKVVIEAGYVDSSGNQHGINLFEGYIGRNGIDETDIFSGIVRFNLEGQTTLLDLYWAEDLPGNQVTGETLTDIDDNEYLTTQSAVGIVRDVYDDGVRLLAGRDYEVGDLNEKDSQAVIALTESYGDPNGAITADYVYWYTDVTFESIIEALLDHANIVSRNIQSVVFPTQILTTRTVETDADFNAGTFERSFTDGNDKLYHNFLSYDSDSGLSSYPYTADTNPQGNMTRIVQSFTFDEETVIDRIFLHILSSRRNPIVKIEIYQADSSGFPTGVVLSNLDNISINVSSKTFIGYDLPSFTASAGQRYCVMISPDTSSYTPSPTFAPRRLILQAGNDFENTEYLSSIRGDYPTDYEVTLNTSDQTLFFSIGGQESYFMSDTIDTDGIEDFGFFKESSAPAVGTYTYYSRTQDADSGWPVSFDPDDWDLIEGGVISSTPRNFIRIAAVLDFLSPVADSGGFPYPAYIDSFQMQFTGDRFSISIANFTGMSVRRAIEVLASMCNYAYGFNAYGTFFFRPKSFKESPDKIISDGLEVRGYMLDMDNIINQLKVMHGGYTASLSARTEGLTRPDSIDNHGVRSLTLNFATIIADPDADSAFGVARLYYLVFGTDTGGRRKVEIVLQPRFSLELGDIIQISSDKYSSAPFNENYYIARLSVNPDGFTQELTLRELI